MFRVVVKENDQVLRYAIFDAEIVSIGRHEVNDIRIGDSEHPHTVSRFHAAIIRNTSGDHFVRDLGSKNGIRVNDKPAIRKLLKNGDLIQVMGYNLEFEEKKPEEVILKPEKTRHKLQKNEILFGTNHDTERTATALITIPFPFLAEPGNPEVSLIRVLNALCQEASAELGFCAQVVGDGFSLPKCTVGIAGYEIPRPSENLFSKVVKRKEAAMDCAVRQGERLSGVTAIGLPLHIEGRLYLIYLETGKDRCEIEADNVFVTLLSILEKAQGILSEGLSSCGPNDPTRFRWKEKLVGNSRLASMAEVGRRLQAAAQSELNTLICGETGTGKEIAAGKIHELSGREGDFIVVNCMEFSTGLLRDRLFGHAREVITGVKKAKSGAFEEADKGTLLLDEVGCLDLGRQEILLRPIREKIIRRFGDLKDTNVDVKILFATNEDLEEKERMGLMRPDFLKGRVLEEVPIELPPLRERKDDIPLLVNFFIDEAMHPEVQAVDSGAVQLLWESPHVWPANVQELKALVTRALTSANAERRQVILKKDIKALLPTNHVGPSSDELPCKNLSTLKKAECEKILKALAESFGNKAKAAKKLEISRPTLDSKCKKYGIDPKAFKPKA